MSEQRGPRRSVRAGGAGEGTFRPSSFSVSAPPLQRQQRAPPPQAHTMRGYKFGVLSLLLLLTKSTIIRFLSMVKFCWLSLVLSLCLVCLGEDTVSRSQSIRDGDTLLSPGKTFILGFFSPYNSSNRYIGIWYRNIPKQTVVWVANRENPALGSSGVVTIQDDGNLVLLDAERSVLWSTNITTSGKYTVAKLLDDGNLILTATSSSNRSSKSDAILWQSFDHPSDTLLPGMKIGYNRKTHRNRFLVSWMDNNDPSAGKFSFGPDPHDSSRFFIWRQSSRHWRSGYWNSRTFNHTLTAGGYFLVHLAIERTEDEDYFMYSAMYNNTRLVMDISGQLRCQIWYDASQSWGVVWSQPTDSCGIYSLCGANTICSEFSSEVCECMTGFEPVSRAEWNSGDWRHGCKRKRELQCRGDGFLSVGLMKVPDEEMEAEAASEAECREACNKNCSCTAYVHTQATDRGASKCLHWFGNLIDVGNLKEKWNSQYLHIRVPELQRSRKRWQSLIISATSITGILLWSGVVYCLCRLNVMKGGKDGWKFNMFLFDSEENKRILQELVECSEEFSCRDGKGSIHVPFFSFVTVAVATDHFSDSNLVGKGGFGHVYRGILPGGREIAVKKLSSISGHGIQEFKNEAILVGKLQHRNLVQMLGYCAERNEKMLIYEYMPNKSLDYLLFEPRQSQLLDWEKRFNIILGIARGLLYLHQDSRLRIIHRDLKTSNILLDMDMNPKISDFGTARIFGGNLSEGNTRRVVGTYGYMSPEYALDGFFSVKSDVFSFGVILLEIVSGKKNNKFYCSEDSLSLLGYAWKLWNEGRELELMDPSVRESAEAHKSLKCIRLGLLCVEEDPADRPIMASIVAALLSENPSLPLPKKPASYVTRHKAERVSVGNEISITLVEGR